MTTEYRLRIGTTDGIFLDREVPISTFGDLQAKEYVSTYLRGWIERDPSDGPRIFELLADTSSGSEFVGEGRVEPDEHGPTGVTWASFKYRRRFSEDDRSVGDPHDVPRAASLGKPPRLTDPDQA